jgi:hypothetical protein
VSMKKAPRFSDQIRAAILNADETRYRIAKATGIPEGNLSRIVHGEAWMSETSLNRLCEYLGLRLEGPKKRKG